MAAAAAAIVCTVLYAVPAEQIPRVICRKISYWTVCPPFVEALANPVEIQFFDGIKATGNSPEAELGIWKKVKLMKYSCPDSGMTDTIRTVIKGYLESAIWDQPVKKNEVFTILDKASQMRIYFDIPLENNVLLLCPYDATSYLSGKKWKYASILLLAVPDDVAEGLKAVLDNYYLSTSFVVVAEGEYSHAEHEAMAAGILKIAGNH